MLQAGMGILYIINAFLDRGHLPCILDPLLQACDYTEKEVQLSNAIWSQYIVIISRHKR